LGSVNCRRFYQVFLTIRIGETPMPSQNKPKYHHRVPHQIDLFAEKPKTPVWSALPTETRATLTELIAQLILDHADKVRGDGDVL
jgi:hypothetical protein